MDEMHPLIHLHHFGPKPLATRMFSRKVQSTLSKAFSMSSLITTPFCLFLSHSSMSSLAMRDASRICRPSTKVVCCPVIVKGRTFLRRSNNTLAMILYRPVVRLMGRKSATVRASSFFEIKHMYVSFRLPLITPFQKNSWNTLMISALIKFQHSERILR